MTKTYADFISEQQNKLRTRGLAEQSTLNEAAAIMKHFHGEDQRHRDGSAQSASNNHKKIMSHLHKTLGPKHPVYKKVESHLKKAQKHHETADPHVWDNENKFYKHKEYAHGHEAAAKEVYADHLKSLKSG
jgi:hypothetical protein